MKKKTLVNILTVICLLVAIGCGAYLAYYYYTSAQAEKAFDELREMIVAVDEPELAGGDNTTDESVESDVEMVTVGDVLIQKKYEKLYQENNDFIGWLTIEGTLVDYPVMYTPNDSENGEFYIHRDYEMNYSAAGLPFVDKNCTVEAPTDNVIIYGHNMNAGTMFHDILQYENEDFYNAHKTFTFDTIYEDGTYEVVAAFYGQVLPDDSTEFKYYQFVNAGDEEEFDDFVNHIKDMSVIDTGVDVQYGDKLITLSTCAYHVTDGRFAVIAKKIN